MDPILTFINEVINRYTQWLNRDDIMDNNAWQYYLNGEEKAMPNHTTSEYFKENPFSYPERAIIRLNNEATLCRAKIVELEEKLKEVKELYDWELCSHSSTNDKLDKLKNKSIFKIIKKRFIKWLLGDKGDKR